MAGEYAMSPFYLWVKLATLKEDTFAKVRFHSELHLNRSDVSDVVDAACKNFSHWGINAAQGCLYLVARAGQSMPQQSAIEEAVGRGGPLGVDRTMEGEGITSGAWLVVVSNLTGSSAPAHLLAPIGGSVPNPINVVTAAMEALSAKIEAVSLASQWLIHPDTRDKAHNVVFYILKEGAAVGCGFFVTRTLAFTVSHNIHNNDLKANFTGRTLGGEDFVFEVVVDLEDDDFMILQAPARTSDSYFQVTSYTQCARLLGSKSVALLGCGIAMSDVTAIEGSAPTFDVSLTITETNVCQVGSSNKHFGYTTSTYDGDSGGCLFFSSENCVVGIHQEGVNRVKELVDQEKSLLEEGGGGGSSTKGKTLRRNGELVALTESVKSIIRDMTTGGIGLFLGSSVVQEAFKAAKLREG